MRFSHPRVSPLLTVSLVITIRSNSFIIHPFHVSGTLEKRSRLNERLFEQRRESVRVRGSKVKA
jgi:hypothetical protein